MMAEKRKRRYRRWTKHEATLVIALLLAAVPAGAQWRNLPKDGIPLGPDGKPNMSAAAPRTASGRPDLSGIYTPNYRYFQNLAADLGLENVPMTNEARKIHAARATGLLGHEEPDAHCLPQGVPKINMAPYRSGSSRRTNSSSWCTKHSTCGVRCFSTAASGQTI